MRLRSSLPALVFIAAAAQGCASSGSDAGSDSDSGVAATAAAASPDSALLAAADMSRIKGAADAPVWLLIVSDFECPYCRMWHEQSYDAIVREYVDPGKVQMAYINLPIASHRNAKPAAEAAMCAGVQGRFWELADGIFATQERWSQMPIGSAVFDSIAGAQSLDMPQWRECVGKRRTRDMVEADAVRAGQIGIASTPSFVILRGDQLVRGITGAFPVDTFRVALDAALAGAGTPARP
ncbi:MAG: thioredoxin domain-containing protein [Gemmatimonadaceae bacterium]|nr:thioredoxin domain-containing protein [Gemmatimonadaceae bacterium]